MTWADLKDNECVMEIINTELDEGETAVLMPSGTPFITTMDGDTNPMTPIRAQSGKIGFIATDGFRILPRNSHQWRIVMRREERTMWTGWLKAETYNQRLWGVNEEVTLNVIDDVEALKTWTLDAAAGFGMVTLRSLMTECLAHIHNVTGGDALELEWSMDVSPTSGPFYELFELQVSRYNYFSRVADSEAHEGKTCYDVMESICKVFGWTMSLQPATYGHEGMKMLFSYAGAYNYMKDTFQNFSAATWAGGTDSAPLVRPLEYFQPCGLHDYSIEPGYRKLSVVSKLKLVDNSLPSLDFSDADIKWVEGFTEEHSIKYLREGLEKQLPWRVRLLSPKNDLVRFPRYTIFGEEEFNEVDVEITKSNFDSYLGIALVSHDYWYGPEEDRGSTPQEGEKKLNYSWRTSMLLHTYGVYESTPVLISKSSGSSVFQNGGFEIGFELHLQTFSNSLNMYDKIKPYGGSRPGPLKYGKALGEKDKSVVVFSLRVGEMFWNGETWSPGLSTFEVTVEPQQAHSFASVRTNKTLDMPFTATQHAIPISAHLSGEIDLRMYGTYAVRENGTRFTPERAIIENLTFKYCTPETDKPTSSAPAESHEYTHTEEGWTETMGAVTLDIHSDKGDAANYGVLTYASGTTLKTVYNGLTGETQRPEEALLEKYKSHFTRSREILTLRYFLEDWMEPRNEASIGREVYNLLAVQSVNWKTGEAELVMEHLGAMGSRPEAPERPELPENNALGYTLAFPLGG